MTMSRISGNQAYAHMNIWLLQHRNGFKGWCLRTCNDAWALPHTAPSAIEAWHQTPAQHRHKDLKGIKVGAPIYFDGGAYGHIVLQSKRAGYVISTDAPTPDYIGEVPYSWFEKHWGYKLLGWADHFCGQDLVLTDYPK